MNQSKSQQFALDTVLAIQGLMDKNGISQAELARRIGVSRSAVTQMFSEPNWTMARLFEVVTVMGAEVGIIIGPNVEQFRHLIADTEEGEAT